MLGPALAADLPAGIASVISTMGYARLGGACIGLHALGAARAEPARDAHLVGALRGAQPGRGHRRRCAGRSAAPRRAASGRSTAPRSRRGSGPLLFWWELRAALRDFRKLPDQDLTGGPRIFVFVPLAVWSYHGRPLGTHMSCKLPASESKGRDDRYRATRQQGPGASRAERGPGGPMSSSVAFRSRPTARRVPLSARPAVGASRQGPRAAHPAHDHRHLVPAAVQHPDLLLRDLLPAHPGAVGKGIAQSSPAGGVPPGAGRQPPPAHPPERVPLHREPARRGRPDHHPAAAACRYRVPDLPARPVRRHLVAADAVVGPP